MPDKRSFAIQTLLATLVLNGVLLSAVLLLGDGLAASGQTVLVWVLGAAISLVLWGVIYWLGARMLDRIPLPVATAPLPAKERVRPAAPAATPLPEAPRAQPAQQAVSSESGAVQLLAIMQREGRLIDFLQEDLRAYDDAQIGAAVRPIHEGCRHALQEHIKLEPIFSQSEGSTVSVEPGFDQRAVRLTGSVTGQPPFSGELRHRGWRVVEVALPKPIGQGEPRIVAAAEVEVHT